MAEQRGQAASQAIRAAVTPGMTNVTPDATPETEDTQSLKDTREVALDWVGIEGFQTPLVIGGWEKAAGREQSVVASVRLGVNLEAERKGVHLSRLVEVLTARSETLRPEGVVEILGETCRRQGARQGEIEVAFTYFLERKAPVTKKAAMQGYRSWFQAEVSEGNRVAVRQCVEVPVMTLCPCSKAISDYGAHNQRAYVRVDLVHEEVEASEPLGMHLEEVVEWVEASASSPLYPVLKRADERHVTMAAYDQPVFTEDVAREVVTRLRNDARCHRFKVDVLNEESIHNHSVRAIVQHSNR